MNYKALDEIKFRKLVTDNGYTIHHTTNHYEIVNKDGIRIMVFAISHKKGGKNYVKPVYVRQFMEIIGEK